MGHFCNLDKGTVLLEETHGGTGAMCRWGLEPELGSLIPGRLIAPDRDDLMVLTNIPHVLRDPRPSVITASRTSAEERPGLPMAAEGPSRNNVRRRFCSLFYSPAGDEAVACP